jgi:hypothetical protein
MTKLNVYKKILLLALFIPFLCNGEEKQPISIDSNQSGVVSLSPHLRDLFTQEMRQLQIGMTEIVPLYISGQWEKIVPIASKMQDSYVLKQSLSKQQMHELHTKLSDEFIELDQSFHYLSGMLAHAATMKKPELVGFYFSKMSETCVSCHTKFATQRFPSLAPKSHTHNH